VDVSIVIPVFNERESIEPLFARLDEVLRTTGREYEILFIDDGSTDGSAEQLDRLACRSGEVKVVHFRRNYGQTAALQAGIDWSCGDVIVTIDGDLQNEPGDIPMMLDRIDHGYDLVHGWRKDRRDAWLNRRVPSVVANRLIAAVTRFPIHDLGCTLKAIRREIAEELELYGEMHRFIPILAHARGARCVEVVTRHHARRHGKTKYGLSRTLRVLLDLITVKYILSCFASPMKLFGGLGIAVLMASGLSLGATLAMKGWAGTDMTGNPLLLLAAILMLASIQLLSLGLLGEVNARIYFGSQNKRHYAVRQVLNLELGVGRAVAGRHDRAGGHDRLDGSPSLRHRAA
jgi:glycosyltransferase involved in cell wall biosynthesis